MLQKQKLRTDVLIACPRIISKDLAGMVLALREKWAYLPPLQRFSE
jgi:hypothetical protein